MTQGGEYRVDHSCHRLDGQVAVVTGAASGIGAASARRLASEGATVIVADVVDRGGAEVVKTIVDAGGQAVPFHCDVAEAADWEALRQLVTGRWNRLDILHSNAFYEVRAPVDVLDEADWDRQIAVSLKGSYLGVKALCQLLTTGDRPGSVVLTSSVHALMGLPGRPAYAAAKGALGALGRQLAIEYGPSLRVNMVLPGPILTPIWDFVDEQGRAASADETALKRLGRPEEVAAAVAFLCSADASYITGASLLVDGGWSIVKSGL